MYLDLVPMIGGPDGVIQGPAGKGRFSGVALDDVARVARAVLLSPEEHADQTYDLTGPEELTLAEAAAIVTEVTGQPTHYVEETPEEAYASRASYGAPDWELQGWVTSFMAIAADQQAGSAGMSRASPGNVRSVCARCSPAPSDVRRSSTDYRASGAKADPPGRAVQGRGVTRTPDFRRSPTAGPPYNCWAAL